MSITATELKANLGKYLLLAATEDVYITQYGKIVAKLTKITGCLTAKEVTDLHFFSLKQFRGEENADAKTRTIIAKLLCLFEVIDTTAADCREALAIPNRDYEDAVMIAAAIRGGVDCIVTRNPDHFAPSSVTVLSPAALAETRTGDAE